MVTFLMIPGILTSIILFCRMREVLYYNDYSSLSSTDLGTDLTSLAHSLYPAMILALVSVMVLITLDLFLVREN